MRKSLVFGRSNWADVGDARSRKQDENKIYGERDGDGQPSVRKIEDKRQVGALREQMRSLPADGPRTQPVEQIHRDAALLVHASAFAERVYHRRRRFTRFQ